MNKKSFENNFTNNLTRVVKADKIHSRRDNKSEHKREIRKLEKSCRSRHKGQRIYVEQTNENEMEIFRKHFKKHNCDYGNMVKPYYPRGIFADRSSRWYEECRNSDDRRRFLCV